ncbi:MAG: bifunctional pyr operon transcriptional regulator/uracil phosphoribosyltransferase PyrR [Candidatus Zixiibacteriota bacterium]
MPEKEFAVLMDAKQISHAISRIAHEIVESIDDVAKLAVIGIRSNGDHLADRLAKEIRKIDGRKADVGYMDITLYRDDLLTNPEHPEIKATEILFPVDDKIIILVDDVLFTGRTIRAALNQIPDYGRPRAVRLAVLIDRGGRELPIRADFVGKNIPSSSKDDVKVSLVERGGRDEVLLSRGAKVVAKPSKATAAKARKK